jgi:hypothetical protein
LTRGDTRFPVGHGVRMPSRQRLALAAHATAGSLPHPSAPQLVAQGMNGILRYVLSEVGSSSPY